MGQEEVYNLLKKKPRLCSREIAEILEIKKDHIRHILRRMMDKEIKIVKPTKEEKRKLLEKYPSYDIKINIDNLRLFEIKNDE